MSRRDWNRPRDRIRGKPTESITGSDIYSSLVPRAAPAKPRPSKEQLRLEAERAFKEFTAKRKDE
jgi:hypothetical protein